jgi:hypothetical protein
MLNTWYQIKAVAGYSGLTLDLAKDYVHMQDNKKPEYLAKFASGKVPAFEGSDGFTLFETKAIARYSESCPLYRPPPAPAGVAKDVKQFIPVLIIMSRQIRGHSYSDAFLSLLPRFLPIFLY